ncbi:PHP domain-containing protein [Rhodococcus aerolatus]
MTRRTDLHTHSTASDGTDSPAELVAHAAAAGLDVVAITDHDTTGGWAEAAAALPAGLALVRGMELSCTSAGGLTVHLLGYLVDPDARALADERDRLQGERRSRLRAMAERMAADGYPVDPDEVMASATGSAGRPHLAAALIRGGVVANTDEAFADLLRDGGPYYVDKADTPLADGVRLVRESGGVPVLAHALARPSDGRNLTLDEIAALVPAGLAGLEVDHPEHAEPEREQLRALAAEHDLLVTGSSDYHGDRKVNRLGQCTTADEQLERLLALGHGVPLLTGGA